MFRIVFIQYSLIMIIYSSPIHANDLIDNVQNKLSVDSFAERKNLIEERVSDYRGVTVNKFDSQNDVLSDSLEENIKVIDKSISNYINGTSEQETIAIDSVNEKKLSAAPLRDPFNPSINQLNTNGMPNRFGNSTFLPNNEKRRIPTLKLKGVVNSEENKNGDLLALLQVNRNETFMVRVGDEISYDPSNPTSAIKIVSITRLSVKVQVGNLGNLLIVR